jgi:dTDP-4-dehydrorhamnose 3,5-epimerase
VAIRLGESGNESDVTGPNCVSYHATSLVANGLPTEDQLAGNTPPRKHLSGKAMDFIGTQIADAYLINLARKEDFRGFFARVWSAKDFQEHGLISDFVECNMSYSRQRGTVRGLHYQRPPHEEAKLLRCTRGAVYDVIVDLRPHSPTRYRWAGFVLRSSNERLLYVPPGCAHGIQTLDDDSEILYAVSASYTPEAERGLRWNDPFFDIEWPPVERRIISEKDANWPDFQEQKTELR